MKGLHRDRIILFFACGLGSGWLRPGPGTWGSVAAFLLSLCLLPLTWPTQISILSIATFLVTCAGVPVSGRAAQILGKDDPSEVVIDEFAGTWLAQVLSLGALLTFTGRTFSLWQTLTIWLSALVFFRVFDIWKPWPVSRLEHLPGGLGIMADDVAAGVIGGGAAFFVCACVMSLAA